MESLSKKLSTIVRDSEMCPDPAHYSGHGQRLADLNSAILADIYKGINAQFGDRAASNFVKMVSDLPDLSASNFLNGLKLLEDAKFYWNPLYSRDQKSFLRPPKKKTEVALDKKAGAFAKSAKAVTVRRQDTRDDIAGAFLEGHAASSILRSNDRALNKSRTETCDA